MIINPILPIPVMAVISIIYLAFCRKGIGNFIRQFFIVLLLFVINLRIMVGSPVVKTMEANMDVLFVIDNTISMLAEDYDGNNRRIDGVKRDVEMIIDTLAGAEFGVVTFDNNAQQRIPFTNNKENVMQAINSINGLSEMNANGTSLNTPIRLLEDILSQDEDAVRIVFFISDGEITSDEELESYKDIGEYVDGGAVLGYGTSRGGEMQVSQYYDYEEADYLYYYDDDYNRVKAVSVIDEGNLKSIARDLGVSYYHFTSSEDFEDKFQDDLEDIVNLMSGEMEVTDSDSLEGYEDTYYWLLIPLSGLLLADYIIYRRKLAL